MLNVGIIGIGNAGNQVCAYCTKKYPDIPLIAMNCSSNDMQTIPNSIRKVAIGDGKGAGKNREEAKKFLENSIMEFLSDQDIKDFLKGLDIVFIVSSTGGGTGSGISLLLADIINQVYRSTSSPVFPITVGILPTVGESLESQANTLSYLTELYEELDDEPTYMLYDNDKFAKESTITALKKVNEKIVEDINILRGYYNIPTPYNSIDERDTLTIITTPGRLVVGSVYDINDKDCTDELTLEDLLISDIKKNAHAELQLDGIINRAGFIANLSETLIGSLDTNYPKLQKAFGVPVGNFEHIAMNPDRKLPNNVFWFIGGLTPINDRIIKIKDRIEQIESAQKKKADESELDRDALKSIQAKRVYRQNPISTAKAENDQKIDITGIFNKFKH